ncbi:hypothetical protein [Deinococcus sedimenti]|uniref:Uncharacterized protein n=1 Tax=Deinococcus sedimenti TaxID=1867090 RepID=A0ABQ2S0Y8_9DEIO|nr:hypothetical protein [Deinococcus sedimenti]GGR78249.1 hypothetical protein GCM10008960_01290 [Deinococcus sedimenti]
MSALTLPLHLKEDTELVVEPWGETFRLAAGERYVLSWLGSEEQPECLSMPTGLVVFMGAGATFNLQHESGAWIGGSDIPIPSLPPSMSTKEFLSMTGLIHIQPSESDGTRREP